MGGENRAPSSLVQFTMTSGRRVTWPASFRQRTSSSPARTLAYNLYPPTKPMLLAQAVKSINGGFIDYEEERFHRRPRRHHPHPGGSLPDARSEPAGRNRSGSGTVHLHFPGAGAHKPAATRGRAGAVSFKAARHAALPPSPQGLGRSSRIASAIFCRRGTSARFSTATESLGFQFG